MSASTNRHSRESAAMAGAVYGVSRETVRKSKRLKELAEQTESPDLAEAATLLRARVASGSWSLERAYQYLFGDDRIPLYLKVSPILDERLREVAAQAGCSRQQAVRALLYVALMQDCPTQIFGDGSEVA